MVRLLRRAAFYAAAVAVATWPLAAHPRSLLAGIGGPGDPLLNLWILGWDLTTIHSRPAWLFDGRIFDGNIFYPAERTLAYSDHLIPQAIAMWPLYALTQDPVLCYNALFFLSLVASGLAMDVFVREVTGARWGALLAGLAWAIGPFHFAHIIHLQLQGLYVLPITFLALHRFVARASLRETIALGCALGLQGWTSVYYGVVGGIGAGAAAIALLVAVGRARSARVLSRLALAGLIAVLVVSPVAWIYWRVQQGQGFGRTLFEAGNSAARIDSYLRAPAINRVYGDDGIMPLTRPNARANPANPERQLFPGVLVLVFALIGANVARRSDQRPIFIAMITVAVVGFVLSLGPDGVRPVYGFAHRFIFGFQAIRASARFAVLTHFALAVFAAIGVDAVGRRLRTAGRRHAAAAAVIAVALVEWSNRTDAYMAAPPRTTAIGQWLRSAAEPGAVAYIPVTVGVENTPLMVESLEHRRPIVNGYSGQVPPFYSAVTDALATFPAAEALRTLRDLDVRFVVSPSPVSDAAANSTANPSPLLERARMGSAVIYEMRWTAETEASLALPESLLPPPGVMPFVGAEETSYSIFWTSGVARAEAGRAVVKARQDGDTYQFTVEARTAPWVEHFFEAQDRFDTTAAANLLPLVHTRRIREGRRSADRTFEYDTATHVVKTDGLALPLLPESRDPLTAFFYVRTLPWSTLESVRVPLNDAGRNLILAIRRVGEEWVDRDGQRIKTIRLDCTIEQRIQRRRPVTFSVWLTAEARQLPIAASIEAPFGRVRVQMID